jgi:hypothetical protein
MKLKMHLFRMLAHIVHNDSWFVYHIMQIIVRLPPSYHGHAIGRPDIYLVFLVSKLSLLPSN